VRNEYCETPEDFVARRTRLAFLDRPACLDALPRVVELMAAERGWGRARRAAELKRAVAFMDTFDAAPGGAGIAPGPEAARAGAAGSVDASAKAAAA
jgi:glycerol-3-phosphate dehydrogenase